MHTAKRSFWASLVLVVASSLSAQPATTSNPQALQLLQSALTALNGQVAVSDITLTGTVQSTAGSDTEAGSATLRATAAGASRVDLTFPSGTRSEIRDLSGPPHSGVWIGVDGVSHKIPFHNLASESAWFFPAFGIARPLLSAAYMATYVGHETRNGSGVEHIVVSQVSVAGTAGEFPTLEHLTQIDLLLDSSTLLPVALTFNVHPDKDAGLDIPITIQFSDYRAISGIQVPFHVQRYLNNSLTLDLQFQMALMNSGIPATEFDVR